MIVDAHCHLWGHFVPCEAWFETLVKTGVAVSGSKEGSVREIITKGQMDLSGDLLVSDMDKAGIDKAIIFPLDFSLYSGRGKSVSLEEQHEIYSKATKRHPNRLIAWAGINPRRPDAAKFVNRAIKEWDMKGVKLHPCIGEFYPNDNTIYPVYEKCLELNVPVSIHTGPEAHPYHGKYAMPIYVEEVADAFPQLTIIMAHSGLCWWEEAVAIAAVRPNVYLDIAYWQIKCLARPIWGFYYQLRTMMDSVGPHKILFGSDWPACRLIKRVNPVNWVKAISQPPELIRNMGIEFTHNEIDALMGRNAMYLFGISSEKSK